jgi:hypothetical protein
LKKSTIDIGLRALLPVHNGEVVTQKSCTEMALSGRQIQSLSMFNSASIFLISETLPKTIKRKKKRV